VSEESVDIGERSAPYAPDTIVDGITTASKRHCGQVELVRVRSMTNLGMGF
jgi:hypothetical protein